MNHKRVKILAVLVSLILPEVAHAEITAERNKRGVAIKIDGKLFTEYLTNAGHSPAMWPVIGPSDKPVTRSYPFTARSKDGTDDHPHHQSIWFTHDKVNGVDYWAANKNDEKKNSGPHIAHREFIDVSSTGAAAKLVTRNDWMNGEKRICEDERTIVFGKGPADNRWIDFTITIKATDGDVTFGDTKEGTFAVRVADSMRVDANQGGHIVNSDGNENVAAWGLPARWVDYTGPVDDETVGIAIMSHPKSFRPLPRWHVRTYGLFTANPFGHKDFPAPEAAKQGEFTLKKGDAITLRYRVLLHRGKTNAAEIDRAFNEFAAS
jgi:Methane oxygenase PmoA